MEHEKLDIFVLYKIEDEVPGENADEIKVPEPLSPTNNTQKPIKREVSETERKVQVLSPSSEENTEPMQIVELDVVELDVVEVDVVELDVIEFDVVELENAEPMQNVEPDTTELSNESDTLSRKDTKNKVVVEFEFTKFLQYDSIQLKPTLAENYEKAKASYCFLN